MPQCTHISKDVAHYITAKIITIIVTTDKTKWSFKVIFFLLFNDPGWFPSIPVYASLMTFFDLGLVCLVSNVGWSFWVLQHKIFQAAVPDRRQVLEDVRWRNPFLHWQRRGHYLVCKSHGMWHVDIMRSLEQFAFTVMNWRCFLRLITRFIFPFVALGLEPRALHIQNKGLTTELWP